MTGFTVHRNVVICCMTGLVVYPVSVLAYVGPGVGLTAIGTGLAVIAGLLLSLIGFIWYPLKRLFGGKRKHMNDESAVMGHASSTDSQSQQDRP
jgi:hypothetical protein